MTYKLVIKGRPGAGRDVGEVRRNLANLFRQPVASMAIFFNGKAVTVKTGLDLETAERMQTAISKTGAECAVIEEQGCREPAAKPVQRAGTGLVQEHPAELPVVPADAMSADTGQIRIINEAPDGQYLSAPLSDRFFAGWHTLIIAGIGSSILGLLCVAVFCIYARIMVGIATDTAALRLEAESLHGGVYVIPLFIWISTILFSTVIVPAKRGQTWGQTRYNLRVVDKEGNEVADILSFGLRLLGNTATIVTYGIPQIVLNRIKEGYSLADVLSGTRLRKESPEVVDFDTPLLLKGIAVSVVCSICISMANSWVESAIAARLSPASQPAVQTIASQVRESREKAASSQLRAKLAQECQEGDNDACVHLDRIAEPGDESR